MGALIKARQLESKARAATSAARHVQVARLPHWSEEYRALPNAILRSALFSVIGRGQRAVTAP